MDSEENCAPVGTLLKKMSQNVTLSSMQKKQMKQRLLNVSVTETKEVYGVFRPIVRLLQQVGSAVNPSPAFQKELWSNVSDLIVWQNLHTPVPSQKTWASIFFSPQLRHHFATAMFVVFLLGGSVSFLFEPNFVSAAHLTYLEVKSGDVSVERADTLFTHVDRMYLDEGDVIKTGPDGYATIFYMDGSVSRLSPSTTVSLELLYLDPQDQTNTKVRVQVLRGRVWSHVGERTPQTGLFQIFSPFADAVIQSVQQSSFDVSVSDSGDMRVTAADNVVSVTVGQNSQTTLLAGDVMTLGNTANAVAIAQNDSTGSVDQWIAQNETEDQSYAQSLAIYYQKEAEFKAGVLPDSPLYGLKTLSEDAQLLLSFNAISGISTRLSLAENRLNEALTLSSQNKDKEALAAIADYNDTMHAVLTDLAALRDQEGVDDYTQADLDALASSVSTLLGTQYRALMTMNSSKDTAVVTQVAADTQKLLSQLQEEHSSVVAQASSILYAAKNALESGDASLALEYFAQYRNEGLSIGVDVSAIDAANRSQAVSEMIAHKTEDMWFLASLANETTQEDVRDAITKTMTATIAQVNRILIGLVQSSDDLALSFAVVDVKADDRSSQMDLLQILKSDSTVPAVVFSRVEAFLRALDGTVQTTTVSSLAPVVNMSTTAEPTVLNAGTN